MALVSFTQLFIAIDGMREASPKRLYIRCSLMEQQRASFIIIRVCLPGSHGLAIRADDELLSRGTRLPTQANECNLSQRTRARLIREERSLFCTQFHAQSQSWSIMLKLELKSQLQLQLIPLPGPEGAQLSLIVDENFRTDWVGKRISPETWCITEQHGN